VLVDTGAGEHTAEAGKLIRNLQAGGIAPGDIDWVILTHCHPDHIGGITLKNGQLAFPNARYAMWKDEWDFWTSEGIEEKLDELLRESLLSATHQNLPPIQDRLDLIEGEKEIVPGIQAISAPGHTPGHMALLISSEGDQLLYTSDLVLHPIHLEQPEWCALFDFAPEQVAATRRKLLNWAASQSFLLHAFHFPFPGLGHVVQQGEGWSWQRL
jgi:glyoxylase-like metal-dependent hydrolase (beta-lactamase superfamily II)